ncbi:MAG TPA: ATP-binding cassette domain-containing protein [Afipia sp.]
MNILSGPFLSSKSLEAGALDLFGSDFALSVAHLSIRLPDADGRARELISDLSFTLGKNEIVALLGRSGAGKTTILNCIAGFIRPFAGRVTFPINQNSQKPPFGYLFQEDRLLPWRTAVSNVELSLERLKRPYRQHRSIALQAIARVGLSGAADRYPWQLSGGMKARVALARALALEAPLLLLDEPFGKLDPMIREEMHDLLLTLHRDIGFSALIVTHDVAEAALVADRALILDPNLGRVTEMAIDRARPDMAELLLKELKRS